LIIKTALLKWVALIGELTHPGFASFAIPLFAFGGKREFGNWTKDSWTKDKEKTILNPLSAEGEERVDKRSDVGVSRGRFVSHPHSGFKPARFLF
jgi:hypothetical protein